MTKWCFPRSFRKSLTFFLVSPLLTTWVALNHFFICFKPIIKWNYHLPYHSRLYIFHIHLPKQLNPIRWSLKQIIRFSSLFQNWITALIDSSHVFSINSQWLHHLFSLIPRDCTCHPKRLLVGLSRYDSRRRRLIFIEFEYLGSSHQQSKITFD